MIDKAKLSFWDIFTYFLSGFTLSLNILFIIIFTSFINIDWGYIFSFLKSSTALITLLIPIFFLIIGMLFEPIANMFEKFSDKNIKKLEYSKPRGIGPIENQIKKYVPEGLERKSWFRFCKSTIEANNLNHNFSIFLARFGFYRNISTLLIMNSVFFFIAALWSCSFYYFLLSPAFYFISIFMMERAVTFKKHLEYEVYFNFIALKEDRIFKATHKENN